MSKQPTCTPVPARYDLRRRVCWSSSLNRCHTNRVLLQNKVYEVIFVRHCRLQLILLFAHSGRIIWARSCTSTSVLLVGFDVWDALRLLLFEIEQVESQVPTAAVFLCNLLKPFCCTTNLWSELAFRTQATRRAHAHSLLIRHQKYSSVSNNSCYAEANAKAKANGHSSRWKTET